MKMSDGTERVEKGTRIIDEKIDLYFQERL